MSLNQCNIIGRLGQDPELRNLPDGTAVVNISIAVSSNWKDKNTGEQKEKTEWIRANSFGKQAEIIAQYFHKGSQIYISGQMETRKYQQDGSDRYATSIRIREFQFLDKKSDNTTQQQPQQYQQNTSVQNQPNQGQPQNQAGQQPVKQAQPGTYEDFNDDIPFMSLTPLIRAHII